MPDASPTTGYPLNPIRLDATQWRASLERAQQAIHAFVLVGVLLQVRW